MVVLTGYITEKGELEVTLPEGLPVGKVEISIRPTPEENSTLSDETWTEEELEGIFESDPKTGEEIIAELYAREGWWDDPSITDGQAWVEEVRRKAAEKRSLPKW